MGLQGVLLNKCDILMSAEINGGVVQSVADCLGCDPNTIYNWWHRDPEVKEAFSRARQLKMQARLDKQEEIEQRIVDKAYASAEKLVEDAHPQVTMFVLERKAKWNKPETQPQQQQALTLSVNLPKELSHDSDTVAILPKALPATDPASVEERS